MDTKKIPVTKGNHKPVTKPAGEEPANMAKGQEDVNVTRDARPRRESPRTIDLDFGCALEAVRHGKAIYRKGWNCEQAGQHCSVYLVNFSADNITGKLVMMVLEKPDGSLSQWHPSMPDVLAEDWCFENIERQEDPDAKDPGNGKSDG